MNPNYQFYFKSSIENLPSHVLSSAILAGCSAQKHTHQTPLLNLIQQGYLIKETLSFIDNSEITDPNSRDLLNELKNANLSSPEIKQAITDKFKKEAIPTTELLSELEQFKHIPYIRDSKALVSFFDFLEATASNPNITIEFVNAACKIHSPTFKTRLLWMKNNTLSFNDVFPFFFSFKNTVQKKHSLNKASFAGGLLLSLLQRSSRLTLEQCLSLYSIKLGPNVQDEYIENLKALFDTPLISLEDKFALLDTPETPEYPTIKQRIQHFSPILQKQLKQDTEHLTAKNIHINPALLKVNGVKHMIENNYPLSAFMDILSIKKTLTLLIGSSHKEEINLFNNSKSVCTHAFSVLRRHFTNPKTGKFNHHDYISFLTYVNEAKVDGAAFSLAAPNFSLAVSTIGLDGIIKVVGSQNPLGARDTLNFIAAIVSNECDIENERQTNLILRWLGKNKSYSIAFHDYLKNKEMRDLSLSHDVDFFQTKLQSQLPLIKSLFNKVPEDWEIALPTNSLELARIGRAQRHCVGSRIYADSCQAGSSIIFSLYEKHKGLKHGFTFEFTRSSHTLIQAEGFARKSPDMHIIDLATNCYDLLIKN